MRNLRILFVIMILAARSSALAETTTSAAPDPAVTQLADGFVSGTVAGATSRAFEMYRAFPRVRNSMPRNVIRSSAGFTEQNWSLRRLIPEIAADLQAHRYTLKGMLRAACNLRRQGRAAHREIRVSGKTTEK